MSEGPIRVRGSQGSGKTWWAIRLAAVGSTIMCLNDDEAERVRAMIKKDRPDAGLTVLSAEDVMKGYEVTND